MAFDIGEGSKAGMDDYETLMATTDVELLQRAWRNEKVAPEILRFQTQLVKRTRDQIQLMEETVEEYEGSGLDPLTVSLYQMDLDRAQFLLRSYLRTRLQKLEKYMFVEEFLQVLNSGDVKSKKLLDALIRNFVEEFHKMPEERDLCAELISSKKRIVSTCFLLWVLVVFMVIFFCAPQRSFRGPLPT